MFVTVMVLHQSIISATDSRGNMQLTSISTHCVATLVYLLKSENEKCYRLFNFAYYATVSETEKYFWEGH